MNLAPEDARDINPDSFSFVAFSSTLRLEGVEFLLSLALKMDRNRLEIEERSALREKRWLDGSPG